MIDSKLFLSANNLLNAESFKSVSGGFIVGITPFFDMNSEQILFLIKSKYNSLLILNE